MEHSGGGASRGDRQGEQEELVSLVGAVESETFVSHLSEIRI